MVGGILPPPPRVEVRAVMVEHYQFWLSWLGLGRSCGPSGLLSVHSAGPCTLPLRDMQLASVAGCRGRGGGSGGGRGVGSGV